MKKRSHHTITISKRDADTIAWILGNPEYRRLQVTLKRRGNRSTLRGTPDALDELQDGIMAAEDAGHDTDELLDAVLEPLQSGGYYA